MKRFAVTFSTNSWNPGTTCSSINSKFIAQIFMITENLVSHSPKIWACSKLAELWSTICFKISLLTNRLSELIFHIDFSSLESVAGNWNPLHFRSKAMEKFRLPTYKSLKCSTSELLQIDNTAEHSWFPLHVKISSPHIWNLWHIYVN